MEKYILLFDFFLGSKPAVPNLGVKRNFLRGKGKTNFYFYYNMIENIVVRLIIIDQYGCSYFDKFLKFP